MAVEALFLVLLLSIHACYSQTTFPTIEEVFGPNGSPSTKYLVITVHQLGLANRLRTIANWHSIARLLNRHLVVSWRESRECKVKLDDLFEAFPAHMTVLAEPLPFDHNASLAFLEESLNAANISNHMIYGSNEKEMWEPPFTSFFLASRFAQFPQDVIGTVYDGILSFGGVPCQHYTFKHTEALQRFRPRAQFAQVVDGVLDRFFSTQLMVGVHVRVHDSAQDWEVVPPTNGGSFARRFGDGATLDHFTQAMRSIESHFRCGRESESSRPCPVRFFIASNGPQEKSFLLSQFPDAIAIHCDLSRETLEGMQCAFIEWLVLSRAALILNTYGSSFAEEAAQVNMRPLLSIWNGNLVHHRSMQLPFCGCMQHAKLLSDKTVYYNFTEGTVDNRQILGGLISLGWCDSMFSKWGLEDVYCLEAN